MKWPQISAAMRPRKTYIFPTKNGFVFLGLNGVITLTAATYNNNLIYILSFIMFSVFVTTMLQTAGNLRGLTVNILSIKDSFAGQQVAVSASIGSSAQVAKQGLELRATSKQYRSDEPMMVEIVRPGDPRAGVFRLKGQARGVHCLRRVTLSTIFPLGLFRAWQMIPCEAEFYVYPEAMGSMPLRTTSLNGGIEVEHENEGRLYGTEFKEHRDYQQGESYRHIDWKVYARKRRLLKKVYDGNSDEAYLLDYRSTKAPTEEERLSQLSKWVEEAKRRGVAFELVLPAKRLRLNVGPAHGQKCLRELAKFKVVA